MKKQEKKELELSEFNKHLKYTPFLTRHGDFKNIFYDTDIKHIRVLVKELSDTLKAMELRMERHDTLQVAKSVFDYVSQKEMYFVYPYLYYDFRFGDWRVCIACYREHKAHRYYICVSGTTPPSRFNAYITDLGYGDFETLEEAITLFSEIIHDLLLPTLQTLF